MAKKLTGDLAETSVGGPNVTITGTTAANSLTITAVSSTAAIAVGEPISGAGIPSGATIAGFTSNTITLSAAATATASAVSLTVGGETQVIGLQEWSIDYKRKTLDATTTDDAAWESSLPSSKSWTAKAKYIFYDGDPSQLNNIMNSITSAAGAVQWNFFPDAQNSDVAFTGQAYVDGITFAAGVGKLIGLDVSLKGTGPLVVASQIAPVANPNTITGEQAMV